MDAVKASAAEILATSQGCEFVDMLMRRLSEMEADNQRLHSSIEALALSVPERFNQPRRTLIFHAKIARPQNTSIQELGAKLKEQYGRQCVGVTLAFCEKGYGICSLCSSLSSSQTQPQAHMILNAAWCRRGCDMLGVIDFGGHSLMPTFIAPDHVEELCILSDSLPELAAADDLVWVTTTSHAFIWSAFCLEFDEAVELTVDDDNVDTWVRTPRRCWASEYGDKPGMPLRDRLPIAQSVDGFVQTGSGQGLAEQALGCLTTNM